MLLFAWLSALPGNNVVYCPNRILKGMDPVRSGSRIRNPFAWIWEALSSSEKDVIAMSGVDTAVYFVFLSTVLGILVLSGIILLPVLLPIAITDNGVKTNSNTASNATTTINELDKLSMGNITEKSPRLWAFLAATYWVSFVTLYLLWKSYKHVAWLRSEALRSPEVKAEQFAVVVRDIPPVPQGQTRKEQVDSYFRAIYPDTYYRSMIVTDNKVVNKIWDELEGYKKKLARAEAVYEGSKTTAKPEGTRPTNKTGFLGLVGEKVDTIEYCNEKINELTAKLETEQKVTLKEKQQNAALVFFTSRVAAASAAQSLHAQIVNTWTVFDAPEPRQLLWSNLKIKFFEREVRHFHNSEESGENSSFHKANRAYKGFEDSFGSLSPSTCTDFILGIAAQVLNVFIGVTLGGTLFKTFKTIQKNPDTLVTVLATSLPSNATFFLTFVALKFFVGYGLELSRIVPLIIYHLKRKYVCKTEEEVKDAWYPGDLGYGTRVPGDMLIVTIVFCYSVIAPLIIPFGVIYFGLGWLILRNQALKVYVPSYESYGRMWPHMNNRIIASLILYQLTMCGYFGVQKFYYTPLLIPLPILSIIFGFVCAKKFYPAFQHPALEVAAHSMKEHPNMEQIFRSFLPPSLSADKIDDDQFEDALSQVSRSASIV
ncbi:CSC1-like protein ERD4 [Senna tora]|uniref:CSC1-like protein ERD4 n=1 Tax=Senna tora TaxID=362788 RepID=A0A835CHW1_9FABA|nr:CSC1-like protein ERD4 [Senna tora]